MLLFFLFYAYIFSAILPLVYQSLKTRALFLNQVFNDSFICEIIYLITSITYNSNLIFLFVNYFLNFSKVFIIFREGSYDFIGDFS